ncbi:heavy metal sensor histidine kinase [Sulfuricystis multivorans]|uniref:heavy metal sensor histidine kinase n=1 Tax=Sulfuricystis multivorans TaxID=2211108 RepID=UPI000F8167DA|nr:heavy metal sensor histidine kinase [Sulfuricystis multivorans]
MTTRQGPSLTLRLTLSFALASVLVLFLLGLIIGDAVEKHFEEQDIELLSGKMELVRHILARSKGPWPNPTVTQELDDALTGHHGLAVTIRAADGRIVFTNDMRAFPSDLSKAGAAEGGRPVKWIAGNGLPMRGIVASAETAEDGTMLTVGIATEIDHHEHFMKSFRHTLWSFVATAALVMGMLGWFVAQRGLSPLKAIKQRAAAITANNLHFRLPSEAIPRELAELTDTLNGMLSRLEESFQRLADFSSNLAHELRTPISNLLTQTQVMLSRARSADEYCDVLASNAEEFERLSRMISDMLFLAKADNNQIIPNLEPVDLAEEVHSLLEYYEILAEEKRLHLSVSGNGVVNGDRLMLRRAISNLLSNAIRHTPEDGSIAIRIHDSDQERVGLSVENSGPAIPPEHLERLFDRFYRADSARNRTTEGAGLGLAITRSILRAHGGDVHVTSADQSTRFMLLMPAKSGE